jgi:hypothetical protein
MLKYNKMNLVLDFTEIISNKLHMLQINTYAIQNLRPTFNGVSVASALAHVDQVSNHMVDHNKLRWMEMIFLHVDFFLLFSVSCSAVIAIYTCSPSIIRT